VDAENAKNRAQVNNFLVPFLKKEAGTLPQLFFVLPYCQQKPLHKQDDQSSVLQPKQNGQPTVDQSTHRRTKTSEQSLNGRREAEKNTFERHDQPLFWRRPKK
jgi:hypothetical protein